MNKTPEPAWCFHIYLLQEAITDTTQPLGLAAIAEPMRLFQLSRHFLKSMALQEISRNLRCHTGAEGGQVQPVQDGRLPSQQLTFLSRLPGSLDNPKELCLLL